MVRLSVPSVGRARALPNGIPARKGVPGGLWRRSLTVHEG